MTEEEAKQKWCPFVRLQANYDGEEGSNRTFKGIALKEANCIASDCACWVPLISPFDNSVTDNGHCGLIRG